MKNNWIKIERHPTDVHSLCPICDRVMEAHKEFHNDETSALAIFSNCVYCHMYEEREFQRTPRIDMWVDGEYHILTYDNMCNEKLAEQFDKAIAVCKEKLKKRGT